MKRSIIAAAASIATAVAFSPLAHAQSDTTRVLQGLARQAVVEGRIPGVVIAVATAGARPEIVPYGIADVASATPVNADTRFEIGSVTKQFTAAAILQLRAAGKLSLDDRLGRYVPEYAAARDVTIRQLLQQVSGIPDYTDGADVARGAQREPGSFSAMLARVANKPLAFQPGTRWQYSNTNYILLGKVVELTAKTSWESWIRAHVFGPAGMTHSGFMGSEATIPDMATGYRIQGHKAVRAPAPSGWAWAAGSIVSTAGDMLAWDDALFGGRVISQADLRMMTTSGRLNDGRRTSYGFGLEIKERGGRPVFEHEGGTRGFGTVNSVYPRLHQRIVVLGNSAAASLLGAHIFAVLHPQPAAGGSGRVRGERRAMTAKAREWWRRLATGDIDRTQLTPQFARNLTPALAGQLRGHLVQLGEPAAWNYRGRDRLPNGNARYTYAVSFKNGMTVAFSMDVSSSGKIASFTFE